MRKKAVFFDKDGVLNKDNGLVAEANKAEIFDDAAHLVALVRKLGYATFIVTNQPIVARGIVPYEEIQNQLLHFQSLLQQINPDVNFDKILFCPHHPDGDSPVYGINCECRKPKPGMLLNAAKEFDIDLKNSYMIGDRWSDIIAGYLAGCKTIWLQTGMHVEKMIRTDLPIPENIKPDFIVNDLSEIKNLIQ